MTMRRTMTMTMPKIYPLALSLCSLYLLILNTSTPCDATSTKLTSSLRGTDQKQDHRKLQRPDNPCLLVRVETEYESLVVDDHGGLYFPFPTGNSTTTTAQQETEKGAIEVRCELLDGDVEKAGGHNFVPIVGLVDGQLDNIESGVSTLVADGAVFLDGALQIPQDAKIEIGSVDDIDIDIDIGGDGTDDGELMRFRSRRTQRSRRLNIYGNKKVLVVRAIATDKATTADVDTLSNNIFGTMGDTITLKSQYDRCSHGKLTVDPFVGDSLSGETIDNGVVEVTIQGTVQGADKFSVEDAMVSAARNLVGNLRQFDHVMLCVPSGTGNWIAYAYVNSWLSVYNDAWCQQLSTQVHEIGHNLGLSHSGSGGNSYADKSGMMGYSYNENNGPLQCFNPSKSYELGWYDNSVVEWDPINQGTWMGNIVGVDDYDENSYTKNVIVKIARPNNGQHLYIGYNRKKGINRGVKLNGDKVVIIEEAEGYEVSNFVAGLKPSTSATTETFDNFEGSGRNLVIEFSSYGASEDEAFVAIYFDDCRYPDCCDGNMCSSPTPHPTKSPTARPTNKLVTSRPTNPPTRTPTRYPTRMPTIALEDSPPEDEDTGTTPIIMEILPNPAKRREEYIEIYNPHSIGINLQNYEVCVQNGNKGDPRCDRLIDFTLAPGAFFMICRDPAYTAESRTCHQKLSYVIRNVRNQFVTLQHITDNSLQGNVDTVVIVDDVKVPSPRNHATEAYVRMGAQWERYCGKDCWTWSMPATASIEDMDDEFAEASIDRMIDIQTLPPTDEYL